MSDKETKLLLSEVRALRSELAELRALLPVRDAEGEYKTAFVKEMSRARREKGVYTFSDSASFLKQIKKV